MSDLPNDFPTEEELAAQFQSEKQFQPEEPIAAAAASEEPEPETAPVPPSSDDLVLAQRFLDWTKQNPEGWNQILGWERGENVIVPRSFLDTQNQTQSAPVDEEPTDYYSEDYLKGLHSKITGLEHQFNQRMALEARAAVDEGVSRFQTKHTDLEASDFSQVVQFVYDRGLLNSIPDDLSSPAKSTAVEQRFEEAYRAVFYDRSREQATRQVVSDMNARRRASSSSSAASTPRVEPAPSTPQEQRAAYVDAIAQALAEGGGN